MPNDTIGHQQGLALPTGRTPQQDGLGAELQHDNYSQQPQSQAGDEQGSQGATNQDLLTQQLHQVLVGDLAAFWQSTVAPSTQSIAQCTTALQKDAGELHARADAELQGVLNELTRVHGLVASFQDQIRETLSMLQG